MTDLQTGLLTGDDLLEISAQQSDKRFELIEMPSRELTHGKYENLIAVALTLYNRQKKLGTVFSGEINFYTRGDTKTVRAADVAFISYERLPSDQTPETYSNIPPNLVVEVVSPNDRAEAIQAKVNEWLDFGVQMVWVVYPKTRSVQVTLQDRSAYTVTQDETITGGEVLPGFSATVREFFEE